MKRGILLDYGEWSKNQHLGENPLLCISCGAPAYLTVAKIARKFIWQFCTRERLLREWRDTQLSLTNGNHVRLLREENRYTVGEVSELTGLSKPYIRYLVLTGKIPFYRILGRVVFTGENLDAIKLVANLQKAGKRGMKRGSTVNRPKEEGVNAKKE